MSSRASARVQILLATCAAISVFLVAPASAGAATVLNGDFETGNLSGWQVLDNPSGAGQTGSWFAYSGTSSPLSLSTVPAPPAGNYAAITDQEFVGTHILYQDVALEPNWTHELSMTVYYVSKAPLVTPMPDTLSSGGGEGGPPPNQQYRIDVMKPTASPESVNPEDILATVFATGTGSPQQLGPAQYTANLTPFAGQTVRLRLAEVDNEGPLHAGVDSVAIQSTPPSNAFSIGKPVLNEKKGTAKLPVTVPGPGTLTIADVKKAKVRIKAKTLQTLGTAHLPVTPTKSARKTLKAKGRLKLKVAVTFAPTGGLAATQTRKLVLRLAPKK
ncbi:MAG: hypothetical protein ACTHK6_03180 [Solirubrobacterales bacterium]